MHEGLAMPLASGCVVTGQRCASACGTPRPAATRARGSWHIWNKEETASGAKALWLFAGRAGSASREGDKPSAADTLSNSNAVRPADLNYRASTA
jgi:hypothetical protein